MNHLKTGLHLVAYAVISSQQLAKTVTASRLNVIIKVN